MKYLDAEINPFRAESGHLNLVGQPPFRREKEGEKVTGRERELIGGKAEQLWADTRDIVASLRDCVLGQRWPAWGPIIICCFHSANHSTLPLHIHIHRLSMSDICLGKRSVVRFPTDFKSWEQIKSYFHQLVWLHNAEDITFLSAILTGWCRGGGHLSESPVMHTPLFNSEAFGGAAQVVVVNGNRLTWKMMSRNWYAEDAKGRPSL